MRPVLKLLNPVVAAFLLLAPPALADEAKLDALFTQLQSVTDDEAGAIEEQIWQEWSHSGSPMLDLLLQRGDEAMAAGDLPTAIGHFSAIIDHDPAFAEAWNQRATAYFQKGDLGPSIADIEHVLALNPRHFGALSGLGMIFEELDEPDKALEVYQMALAVNPHLADVKEAVKRLSAAKGQDL